MNLKKHFKEIDFIRAVCCILIIIYHFSIYTVGKIKFLHYANGNLGEATVGVFFIVSGFVIYNSYHDEFSIDAYYKKRVKTIFPSFYLCWFIFYIMKALLHGKIIYIWESPWKIIFTIFGIDGYFHGLYPNFYLVGEWFLGAILFCYLIYPILFKFIKESPYLMLLFLSTVSLYFHENNLVYIPHEYTDIFEYVLKFYIGMLLREKYELLNNKQLIFLLFTYFVLFSFIKVSSLYLFKIIYSISLFALLFFFGRFLNGGLISIISNISYQIFLTHHQIIAKVLRFIGNPEDTSHQLLVLFLIVLITILLSLIVKKTIKLFKKNNKK